ncbi:MAG: DegT/DnrJ/EryC1/StrS family aminotransferase [Elusimicrobiota bacterium]
MIPLLDIAREHAALRPRLLRALARVLDSGAFINGPEVAAFEAEFAKAHRARHCAGLSNGTDALELALKACGVGPGAEVVVPAFTFIATGSAVCAVGAKPVFADVEEDSLCLDPKALGRALSRLTKAVVPVHLYGHPADMDALLRVARKARLKVIEDCAQAHLARYHGRFVGTLGHAGTFSFYPTKNLGALGDAGALLTADEKLHAACVSLRDAGRAPGKRYLHDAPGRNARLDEMQAALLRVKLEGLAKANASRAEAAEAYREGLEGLPLRLPPATGPARARSTTFSPCAPPSGTRWPRISGEPASAPGSITPSPSTFSPPSRPGATVRAISRSASGPAARSSLCPCSPG